jgi:hypothetical protein
MSFLFRTLCISLTVAVSLTATVAVRGDGGTSDRTAALRELQFHRTAASLN